MQRKKRGCGENFGEAPEFEQRITFNLVEIIGIEIEAEGSKQNHWH